MLEVNRIREKMIKDSIYKALKTSTNIYLFMHNTDLL